MEKKTRKTERQSNRAEGEKSDHDEGRRQKQIRKRKKLETQILRHSKI